ncbi:MAG TPA: bifunctional D-glycero-beta-D-manno-heptose-7-phosphate kinase/D-glycero-beta-D-manno-heptose 1-phosphate adenylyltransferase HldE [Gammaproteobacteria bacterium]|nr:bifunctional D-glycero-beta-D-manno-heptose-7-phosphate kinase/D-glycero-beta-D-manno-heptose 1-phosphate adenylyltransferase HldE [Gammaproteobacteria bacterium]
MTFAIRDRRPGRVLVVGDVMLDRYWEGKTHRISPEAPVPVVTVRRESEKVGGAGNVAANVVALGAEVDLIGGTGADAASERLQELCESSGISAHFIRDESGETTVKLRVLSQHQQLLRLDFEAERPLHDAARVERLFLQKLPDADIVVLSDYGKGFVADAPTLIAATRAAGKRVIVDPKSNDFSRYAGASMVTPNFAEFEACVGHCRGEGEILERGISLCEKNDIAALLVTRGERGMTLVSPGSAPITLKAEARDVFDVTGAGDTVCAVVATFLTAGAELAEAVLYANEAAGIAVGKLGTATVSVDELERALAASASRTAGVVTVAELLHRLAEARTAGERIVMTNGCFDIVHAGHVAYLEQAKALGTRLIVALNSDASISRLKGSQRPIHRLKDRMAVVGALSAVDWVVSFDEDDPRVLVESIRPDVLVKGGDYEVDDIVGGKSVLDAGGEVLVLPIVEGMSTTAIIQKIVADGTGKANLE